MSEQPVETQTENRTDVAPLIEAIRVLQKAEDLLDTVKTTPVDRANALVVIAREYRVIYESI